MAIASSQSLRLRSPAFILKGNLLAGGHSGQFHEALSAQEGE
jgi:hypothetical protein